MSYAKWFFTGVRFTGTAPGFTAWLDGEFFGHFETREAALAALRKAKR